MSNFFKATSKKTGKTYFLHRREQPVRGNRITVLYYFGAEPGEGAIGAIPDNYELSENARTGLPLLKKKSNS
jgi:hypothetical protein